jgi:putative ABC transport system substrate-binding protein
MRRREFLVLSGAALAFPLPAAGAGQAGPLRRIAFLSNAEPDDATQWQPLVRGLADHGYVDGVNIRLERHIAPGIDALPETAARLVATGPDIILCVTTPAALAAKRATATIPIVFAALNDPVGVGLVMSLARPGGNATGNTQLAPDVAGKQLGILKELLPGLRRLAVLSLSTDQSTALIITQMRLAAQAAAVELAVVEFDDRQDFGAQLERVARAGVQAFFVPPIAYFTTRDAVSAEFQVRTGIVRMVSGAASQPFLGVIGYGPDVPAVRRQSGTYIDAILKGARPADLPVEQPTTFDLTINLKTARAMGLPVPATLLAQATMVVE